MTSSPEARFDFRARFYEYFVVPLPHNILSSPLLAAVVLLPDTMRYGLLFPFSPPTHSLANAFKHQGICVCLWRNQVHACENLTPAFDYTPPTSGTLVQFRQM